MGTELFRLLHGMPLERAPFGVTLGDFNGDGKLDLAVANEEGNTVSILLGNGDGSFVTRHS